MKRYENSVPIRWMRRVRTALLPSTYRPLSLAALLRSLRRYERRLFRANTVGWGDQMPKDAVSIDVGCGSSKKPGCIGIDLLPAPGVDHVLDILKEDLPFQNRSVDYIFSSHFIEHISPPNRVWQEFSRVAKDGCGIEIWSPFAHSDEAFLPGHVQNWSKINWHHLAVSQRNFYSPNFLQGGYWQWQECLYIIYPETLSEFNSLKIPLQFAVRHMVNVVVEWANYFRYTTKQEAAREPVEYYAVARDAKRSLL